MRKFRTEDAGAVSNIIKNNLLGENNKDYSEEIATQAYERFTPKYVLTLSNKKRMYVAVEDGAVVGTAAIDHDTISNVFIKLQYHSLGIDKMLISLLEEIADNFGLKPVKLVTATTLQKRYEKVGYDLIGEIETEELGKQIVMEKY
jgi:Holliday junction resolvasome RuvABC ATP-dependent DNA helicase subunit